MRALVVGGYGFVGRHLAHHLIQCGDDVALTYVPERKPVMETDANRVGVPHQVQTIGLDVTKPEAVAQLVAVMKPDAIYHLSAISSVPEGEQAGHRVFEVNAMGAMNVFQAVADHARETRVLFVSSSEVYGEPRPGALPFTEQSELRPMSAYGVAKAAADLAAYKYSARNGLFTVRVRPFPHFGPGQRPDFAVSSFARQVAAIKLGISKPVVSVGNLEVRRDFTDVLDIVRGYREALLNAKSGEVYNLSSGSSLLLSDLLKELMTIAGVDAEIVPDPARVRAVDISDLYGSYQKAQRDFGWRPRIERPASLGTLLSYWLDVLSSGR